MAEPLELSGLRELDARCGAAPELVAQCGVVLQDHDRMHGFGDRWLRRSAAGGYQY
jgi:hypothetical protein